MKLISLISAAILTAGCAATALADGGHVCKGDGCGRHGAALTVPRDTSFTPWSTYKKNLKYHPELVLASDKMPEGVRLTEDLVYTTLHDTPYSPRPLHADVMRPDDDATYPALVLVHGGGWTSGSKLNLRAIGGRIASHGYVVIPIEYRLNPEQVYPAGLHDVKTAIRYVRSHAAELGVDPDRIAVGGTSAGAQLATLVGVTNGEPSHEGDGEWKGTSSRAQAIVSIDGIATFVTDDNIASVLEHQKRKGELHCSSVWLGGNYEDSKANWHHASAVEWVTPDSPPICFVNSLLPTYHNGRDELMALYDGLGIYNERHDIEIKLHPFWFFTPWIDQATGHITRFLDKTFK